jgi:glutamyl-tRNA synthetase
MKSGKKIEEIVHKYTLKNAIAHEGKARAGTVLGKILSEKPELKKNVKQIRELVEKITNDLNKLSVTQQRKILEEKWPELLYKEKKVEEKKLPPLPNSDKYNKIVTRFSPNPDCVLHLGSIRALILSHDYARIYDGKFLLRFEDTDPRLKKSVLEFYDLIREDIEWLGCKWDKEYIQSDRIPIYYDYAKKIIDIGGAYVCTCESSDFKQKILNKKPCDCRERQSSEHAKSWQKMLEGHYKEGEAIVRIKTELDHPNPAVRDWPALRIIDTTKYPHPRVGSKYNIWPLYNFACGIDDHLLKITHIIRGKEHFTNMIRQKYLYKYFGWEYPEAIHYGRLKIPDATLSKSQIMKDLEEGVIQDFSDPRVATLIAMKRRGINPETFRKIVIDIGPRPVDVTLSWENIYAINRKLVDQEANRYFFIADPIQLCIKGVLKNISSRIPLHPDHLERGYREFEVQPENKIARLYISKGDIDLLKEKNNIRLMELFNFQVDSINDNLVEATFKGTSYTDVKKARIPIIHWLSDKGNIETEVVMPNAKVIKGLAEPSLKNEKIENTVQLMRFGFGRIDNFDNKLLRIYFSHS